MTQRNRRPYGSRGGSTTLILLGVLVGAFAGVGLFTFGYAQGSSYMTDDPAACANCHVMREQHSGWMKASHRSVAVCNDCHTPAGFVAKYSTKALNGFFHSWAFTTNRFPDRIQIAGRNARVTEGACLKCHADIVSSFQAVREHRGGVACTQCHKGVGHQE